MKEIFSNLKRVYKYGKKYNKHFLMFCLGSVLAIIINVAFPIVTAKQLIYITDNSYYQLIIASLIVLFVDVLGAANGSYFIKEHTQQYFRGVGKDIQCSLANSILNMETKDIDKTSSGVFIERLTKDTENLSHVFTISIGHLTGILSQIGVFIAIFIFNKIVALYYLLTSIGVTLIYIKYNQRRAKADKIYRKQNEKVTGITSELIRGIRDIKMLYAKDSFNEEMDTNIDDLSLKLFKLRDVDREKSLIVTSVVAVLEFILIALLILLCKSEIINSGVALILFNYHTYIYKNLMEKVDALSVELKNFNLSANRVFEILDFDNYTKESFGKKELENFEGNFEFKDVYFGYSKNKPVLKGVDFKINANETVAFVGKSGEGKTTIFNLLCKLYQRDSGKITIDGIDVDDLDEKSIRGNITIISQNPYIFNMSIRDNFKLVKNDVTDSEIEEACKLACLDEFIGGLENGYDTILGEGGINLSGGQKQRLAIARALIQKTKIILFDEATSALDNETEASIKAAIDNMKNDYTMLIIAHRLSTIKNADRILYLESGKIIGEGTHRELMKSCPQYKELYKLEISKE